jgi:hypothetical protein
MPKGTRHLSGTLMYWQNVCGIPLQNLRNRWAKRWKTSGGEYMNVALRPEASSDLVSAAAYFNDISDGWGDHFLNTIEVDLADLRDEAGIHAIHSWRR